MKRRKKQRKNISKNYVGISDYLMQNNFHQNEEIRGDRDTLLYF